MRLNGKVLPMEVDTGAAVSIISQHTYCKHLGSVRLLPAALQLHTYTDERLVVEGKCKVTVEYKGQQTNRYLCGSWSRSFAIGTKYSTAHETRLGQHM